jgi:hypothetical protein
VYFILTQTRRKVDNSFPVVIETQFYRKFLFTATHFKQLRTGYTECPSKSLIEYIVDAGRVCLII